MRTLVRNAPATYQDWMDCFAALGTRQNRQALLDSMQQGAPVTDPYQQELYIRRLDQAVTALVNDCIQLFLAQLNQLLEEGDADGAILAARRFGRQLSACFFYQQLSWIPAQTRQQLTCGYLRQVEAFWSRLVAELRADADQHPSRELEDLVYCFARLERGWRRKGMETA